MGKQVHYEIESRRKGSKHWHWQPWRFSRKIEAAQRRNKFEQDNPRYEWRIVRVETTEKREVVK